MFDPIFLEDLNEAFAPLFEHARSLFSSESAVNRFIDKYMYMYSDKTHSFFKHEMTREYIKLPRK